jgi:hypothetical protein
MKSIGLILSLLLHDNVLVLCQAEADLFRHVRDLLEEFPSPRELGVMDDNGLQDVSEVEEKNEDDMEDICDTKLSPVRNDARFSDADCKCDVEGSAIVATCKLNDVCLEIHGKTFSGDLTLKMIYLILPVDGKKDIMDMIGGAEYQACFRYNELYDQKEVCLEEMSLYSGKPTCRITVDERPCNGCLVCNYQDMGTALDCSNHFEGETFNQCAGSPLEESLVRFIHSDTKVSTNCKDPGNSLGIFSFAQATFMNFWNQLPDEEEDSGSED